MTRIITVVFLLTIISCSKKVTDPGGQTAKGTDSTTGTTQSCIGSPSDILNIMIFPADNSWNQDISTLAVDPNSTQILAAYSSAAVKADFGSGLWNNAPIEGNGQGDSQVIAVDKDNDILYELYNASVNGDFWEASSGAVFNLASDALRPDGWTSADAAGLPIFPGLVKYDEVAGGAIHHSIRFTLASTNVKPAYISPVTHKVNSSGGQYSLPFANRQQPTVIGQRIS